MKENEQSIDRDEVVVLRKRIEALSALILRVSDNLETSVVLQEVVDAACAMTAASRGLICTINDVREIEEFVTCGITQEEKKRILEWVDGLRMFTYLLDLQRALRFPNFSQYVRAQGFSYTLPWLNTLLAMPMRHHGELVGIFFLGEKAGGAEFTVEDEETIEVFSSQAATAIVNARACANEERALANLEAVIETTPVAIIVLDGKTGHPKSFNREARRLIDSFRSEGQAMNELLTSLTYRFFN